MRAAESVIRIQRQVGEERLRLASWNGDFRAAWLRCRGEVAQQVERQDRRRGVIHGGGQCDSALNEGSIANVNAAELSNIGQ